MRLCFVILSINLSTQTFAAMGVGHSGPVKPANWDKVKKESYNDGVETAKGEVVPLIIGRDPMNKASLNAYLAGTKWTVKIVEYKKSKNVPKGLVISQQPAEYSVVEKESEIKVIVSSGK